MTQLLRIVFQLSWWLGLLNIAAAVVIKLLQAEQRVRVEAARCFLSPAPSSCAPWPLGKCNARAGQ